MAATTTAHAATTAPTTTPLCGRFCDQGPHQRQADDGRENATDHAAVLRFGRVFIIQSLLLAYDGHFVDIGQQFSAHLAIDRFQSEGIIIIRRDDADRRGLLSAKQYSG